MSAMLQELYGKLVLVVAEAIDAAPELTEDKEGNREKIAEEADRLSAKLRDLYKKIQDEIDNLPGADKSVADQLAELDELKKQNDRAARNAMEMQGAAERWKAFVTAEKTAMQDLAL